RTALLAPAAPAWLPHAAAPTVVRGTPWSAGACGRRSRRRPHAWRGTAARVVGRARLPPRPPASRLQPGSPRPPRPDGIRVRTRVEGGRGRGLPSRRGGLAARGGLPGDPAGGDGRPGAPSGHARRPSVALDPRP